MNMSSENSNFTAFLLILESNRKIPVVSPQCRLGRDDQNDIVISDDSSISRFHALITTKDGEYFVNDSKSRHGTFLNGNKLLEPARINDGDLLKIGSSIFWFVIESD